ncbi:MAG: HEAT repeat domain-containing protein, partial [Armatimonadetes bacterium]|nr:HEAT repeat domain-containing protein [Armatimonadota bacterium]
MTLTVRRLHPLCGEMRPMQRIFSIAALLPVLLTTSARAEGVARALAGHYELTAAVRSGLCAEDGAVRARCAFLAGQIGDRAAAPTIQPLLTDSSLAVRRQAGIALCALGRSEGIPAADAALASAADWIRHYAVRALADLATDEARAVLEARRAAQGEMIGKQIDEALETWPWPSAQPAPAKEQIEAQPSLHELFVEAGSAWVVESDEYWHQGDYAQCVRCNETALFLDPHHVELYGASAWLLWSMGRNERAVSILH